MKTALVTGGGRGIGFGIARNLADEGYAIAIMDVQEQAAVQDNLDELASLTSEDLLYCRGDVSSADDRAAVLAAIRSRFGQLNLLVNNAGVAPRERADILDATEQSFERLIRINLQGPYFLTQAVANWMVEQQKATGEFAGCIVNISSISAFVASTSRGEYCISKAGVSMATKLWAARLGEFNIPVYEVQPGVIQTDMTAAVQEKYDKLIADGLCIQKRWGYPADIGRAVAMLARGELAYSTGQVIMIDGGMTLQRL